MKVPSVFRDRQTGQIYFGWYIVIACFCIALFSVGVRNAFGIFVIPMSDHFGWNRTTISFVAALGFLVNGITQPYLGHLFDVAGARRVIIWGLIATGLATVALSATFHLAYLLLVYAVVLSTSLSGPSISNTMALVVRWFQRRRATAVALNTMGTSVGGVVLVPFAMYLLQATNWRVTWAVLGLLILGVAVPLAYLFLRDRPEDMGLAPDGEVPGNYAVSLGGRRREAGVYAVEHWRQSFGTPPIWQLTGAYVVCGITTGIISTHFVPFAIEKGVSPAQAALIFGVMMMVNAAGGLVAGMLSDRFRRKNVLALVYLLRGVAYLLIVTIPGGLGLWAFALFAGFSWVASVPLTSALTADVYGPRALGAISGVTFLCHQVGSFCMVLLAGVLFDLTGSYTLPFSLAGAFLVPAALASFTIREDKYSVRYDAGRQTVTASEA